MQTVASQSAFAPTGIRSAPLRTSGTRARPSTLVRSNKKTDIAKQGLNGIENEVVKNNLMGRSRFQNKKDWVDASGRKGKGYGVYRFENKYGANVDGYSPIYTPDLWSESGDSYKLGRNGLIAWAGFFVIFLGVAVNLILATSAVGQ
ncbi:PSBR1 [Auxenochlorella protothecoides x Auxenochlorella symbiontica]|uniref:Photosystem II 10 kDa polypeptide, chloroplastic n=2 Tax=Auxenochlorella protothecoides TaxID=3075 RepID=A0A087SNZ6_AUXPR|nr:Photosystem II 10 kDa polypeptide, chloroplastic [Auxenochlorella protothecoides]KFM27450.1 Photosystem II 10 kDa polypeptide, chloroplastic [Auxenochlorella protothecoides]RMZ54129.1 hypothetical protein APUTEX25_005285 [Auxenochlorella protothecoides]|eukprot:RMZ54129.1 hypothetical protein APUTEX25_005285 [Auxenochlorella protothecoides]